MKKGTITALWVAFGLMLLGGVLAVTAFFASGGNIGVYYEDGRFFHNEYRGRSTKYIEKKAEFNDVNSMRINADAANIKLVKGTSDKMLIEYSYPSDLPAPVCEAADGKLNYQTNYKSLNFNFNSFNFFDGTRHKNSTITITYPSNVTYSDIELSTDLGDITLNDIINVSGELSVYTSAGSVELSNARAGSIKTQLDLGDINIESNKADKIHCSNSAGSVYIRNSDFGSAELSTDLGDISVANVTTGRLNARASAGSIDISGELRGMTDISCDLGSIDVTTSVPRLETNLELETDLGGIKIDGMASKSTINDIGAPNTVKLASSAGSIDLNFR